MQYYVGIYARLSVKHRNDKDNSIENQIRISKSWLNDTKARSSDEFYLVDIYKDLGCSGTSFCRREFQRMLYDAGMGRINCILCKDTSRLGRDYLKTGEYLEKVFPTLGVRVVCVGEGYDSARDMPGSLSGNLRNLMNEWYARDISRRVRLVKEQKKMQGEYLGSAAPYGWQIYKEKGGRYLKKDSRVEKIIEQILNMREKRLSYQAIAGALDERGISTPQLYRMTGKVYQCGEEPQEQRMHWNASSVRHIILSHSRGDHYTA